jgi:hypothetical protein
MTQTNEFQSLFEQKLPFYNKFNNSLIFLIIAAVKFRILTSSIRSEAATSLNND